MTDPNNELNLGAENDGLEGLPAKELAETKEILGEIAGESAPKDGEPKPDNTNKPEAKPEEKPGEAKAEDGKPKDGDDGKKPEQRRDVKLMPAWLHERSKADWEKREKELLAEVEASKGTSVKPEGYNLKKENLDTTQEAETLAEKHGITVELAQDMLAIASRNGKLPEGIEEKLKAVDDMRNSVIVAAEASAFNADFDKIVLPLVKAEYGDNVPATVIDQVREELKAKAYTPEYAKVPYTILYKGEDQFRGIVAPERKGAEGGRGGSSAQQDISGKGDSIDLASPLHDDVLKTLTDEQFTIYEKNMEAFERSRK